MSKKCFFTGHRDTPGTVRPLLLEAINRHIVEYGVTEFYVGGHGAFDSMAAGVLAEMKRKYPFIWNCLVLAYHPSLRQVVLPTGFDHSLFPEGQELSPPKYAIPTLNRLMVQEAGYLIAYVRMITDGSYKLMQYAMAREKRKQLIITNLAEQQS